MTKEAPLGNGTSVAFSGLNSISLAYKRTLRAQFSWHKGILRATHFFEFTTLEQYLWIPNDNFDN